MNTQTTHYNDEATIDAAIAEAMGIQMPIESAGYQQQLANGNEGARAVDRGIRETVARLATASPFMAPSADLRGRILQATAPTTFRMEDYRKATAERAGFYRWGFIAASVAVVAMGSYLLTMQKALTASSQQAQVAQAQVKDKDLALASLVNPNADQINLMQDGKVAGKAYVDDATQHAVVVLPAGTVPAGKGIQLTLTRNGKPVIYQTAIVEAPHEMFPNANVKMNTTFAVNNVEPDTNSKPVFRATMGQ